MTLTSLIRNLEAQLKDAEKLTRQYDSHANDLRKKLEDVAGVIGQSLGLTKSAGKGSGGKKRRGRKKMSAAGRTKIAAAQRKRWAAWKGKAKKGMKAVVRKAKRKMSPEGRARIVAAQKARWAKVKAAKVQK